MANKEDATKWNPYRAMKRLYRKYSLRCSRRNIKFELTLEQFIDITQQKCSYCGADPAQKSRNYIYNGIDRMDNALGYVNGNVTASCGECNYIKGARLTFDEMKIIGKSLKDYRRKKSD